MRYWITIIVWAGAVILGYVTASEAGVSYSNAWEAQQIYGPEMGARWFSLAASYGAVSLSCVIIAAMLVIYGVAQLNAKED